ncbi:MAG: SdrD B-like domain-containing protein [Bacteroidota bacterium]
MEECDAKVGDFVWNDLNENGIQDPDEPGIEGVVVTLQNPDGSLVDVLETDEDGSYCFLVPKGDYKITFGKPEGNFELTTPNAGGNDTLDSDVNEQTMMTPVFTLEGGEQNLTLDAGFVEICINVEFPGEIGYDQMICAPGNDPDPIISIRDASGGGTPIEYLWMKSESSDDFETGGFKPIPGARFPSYDPGPIDVTTHYARCVRAVGCPDYLEANIITVTVKDDAKAEIIAQPITCYLDLATFEVVTQTANAEVEWEFPGGMNPSSTDDKVVTASFNSFGYYNVKVTVTENNCSTSSSVRVLATYTPTYCNSANFNIGARTTIETKEVMIDWKVLNDGISYSFDVERSTDGSDFTKIAEVKDHKLIKAGFKEYEYMDVTPKLGRNLYRVKMNDPSGAAALSNILDLMLFEPGTRVMVYPNPVQDRLMVEFMEENSEDEITVELATAEGGIIRTFTWEKETVQNNLDFSKLPAGMYFVRVKIGSETTEVMKVMKKE